ncbi:hypothetical protein LOK49_LG05G02398 [Camellia lanceoleosa]|uniref:Uncharacterized protein n=1 Tax=Camellia lanceoleosa TaxID=1840588 RepID=A0ACC0HR40_9ERIC|nr:hypothetical protein LOK49_LG05G02398 [Camellia lanceoleosa]
MPNLTSDSTHFSLHIHSLSSISHLHLQSKPVSSRPSPLLPPMIYTIAPRCPFLFPLLVAITPYTLLLSNFSTLHPFNIMKACVRARERERKRVGKKMRKREEKRVALVGCSGKNDRWWAKGWRLAAGGHDSGAGGGGWSVG